MPRDIERVELSLTIQHETPKAFLVTDGPEEDWLAKSLLEDPTKVEYRVGSTYTFDVPVWWATEKGFY